MHETGDKVVIVAIKKHVYAIVNFIFHDCRLIAIRDNGLKKKKILSPTERITINTKLQYKVALKQA